MIVLWRPFWHAATELVKIRLKDIAAKTRRRRVPLDLSAGAGGYPSSLFAASSAATL
jgi:hypothetical protein